jgi:hypothetical protein
MSECSGRQIVSLDLGKTILQLDRASQNFRNTYSDRQTRLASLIEQAGGISPETAQEKTTTVGNRPYMAAHVQGSLIGSIPPSSPPNNWRTISVDGSHIDVDRHVPIPCYLVNLGGCILTYGSQPDAVFFNQPQLAAEPSDLYLIDQVSANNEIAVTGQLLGILRTVQELEYLVKVVEDSSSGIPTLALIDGTLVLWGLSGEGYPSFVRKYVLHERFLPALERLRELAEQRPVILAAYVSLPRTTEVANAIRSCICPYSNQQCQEFCNNRRAAQSPCNATNGFWDREIFRELLEPGHCSGLYRTNPAAAQEYYGQQQVYFYYLNSGEEIARVEIPQWVASNQEMLALGHSMIVEQCKKGQGYPVAISEAHEQAVINGSDRQLFKQMLIETLERHGLPTYTSEKERSKSLPWL